MEEENEHGLLNRVRENVSKRNWLVSASEWKQALRRNVVKAIGATVISLAVLGVSACGVAPSTDNDNSTDTDTVQTGNENSSNSESSSNNKSNNNNGISTANEQKYSTFLTNILNDESINSLIDRAKADNSLYSSAEFDPHPYTFLAKQGHNIAKIKSGELECNTKSYIPNDEPNNLYMMTYVETPGGSVPYYTEYCIKYTLTDQEVKDYNMLHFDNGHYYIQAMFANDAISATHTATIISKTKMSKTAHNTLTTTITKNPYIMNGIGNEEPTILLKDFSVDDQTFDVYLITGSTSDTSIILKNCKIAIAPLTQFIEFVTETDGIFTAPYGQNDFARREGDEYQNSIFTATVYTPQNADLKLGYGKDLED
jgi:hypothetical protein